MINTKFLICTECQKNSRKKSKQFLSLRGLNIHLTIRHKSKYKLTYQNGKFIISRLKKKPIRFNL